VASQVMGGTGAGDGWCQVPTHVAGRAFGCRLWPGRSAGMDRQRRDEGRLL